MKANMRPLVFMLLTSGICTFATQTFASGFQLWEQDGASVGQYHAGYAALLNDASAAFYNPAGISRFDHPELVLAGSGVFPSFKYKGSVTVFNGDPDFIPPLVFDDVSAQGGVPGFVPAFHFVMPINNQIGFGLSAVVPFGLKTDYGSDTPLRYQATLSAITVVNISPALSFKLTDKVSLGFGIDIQRADADFNSFGILIPIGEESDTKSINKADDTAYGYHLGFLYEFTPYTRVGISYHSKVKHKLTGTSKFSGPIADALTDNLTLVSNNAEADVTLPAYTALSIYHRINPCFGVMGSVIYTQWDVFKTLRLQNVAGAVPDPDLIIAPSTAIQVVIPENYRNTWNFSIGGDYYMTDRITLRGGLGYDETPVRNALRNVQLPDNDRYIIALGGHYQAGRTLGLDIGWSHFIVHEAGINPPPQVAGGQAVETHGNVTGGADVVAGQVTWDID